MHNIYKVGGHCFKVSGSILCSVLERMAGFAPFEVAEGDDNVPEFFFMEGKSGNIPAFCERQYVFALMKGWKESSDVLWAVIC